MWEGATPTGRCDEGTPAGVTKRSFVTGRSLLSSDPLCGFRSGSECSVWSMISGLFRLDECDLGCDLAVIWRGGLITVSHGIFS